MRRVKFKLIVLLMAFGLSVSAGQARELYMIDAHSQIDQFVDRSTIVPLMDKAGIRHVILSTRGRVTPKQITRFAAKYPDRITAAVRTKSRQYATGTDKYYRMLNKQLNMPGFGAMAELIMWHAKKGNKAPEWVVAPDAPQVQAALKAALDRGWPFVIHIEFAASRSPKIFMEKMEAMISKYPDHPFALIHMGQLQAKEAARLLAKYDNFHFLVSHANPVVGASSNQPWIDLFDGGQSIAPRWRALMIKYPDQFILNFDNVWADHWGKPYIRQAKLWRAALAELPEPVAHKIAHENAERLWKLPTAP